MTESLCTGPVVSMSAQGQIGKALYAEGPVIHVRDKSLQVGMWERTWWAVAL